MHATHGLEQKRVAVGKPIEQSQRMKQQPTGLRAGESRPYKHGAEVVNIASWRTPTGCASASRGKHAAGIRAGAAQTAALQEAAASLRRAEKKARSCKKAVVASLQHAGRQVGSWQEAVPP